MGRRHVKRLSDNATMIPFRARLIPALFLSALVACAPSLENQLYQGTGSANLVVRQVSGETGFSGLHTTSIAIYRETRGRCAFDFVGTIKVREDAQSVALPMNERIVIKFNFMGSRILSAGPSYNGISRMVTLRAGRQYEIQMSEDRNGIDYAMLEITGGQRRVLELDDLQECE